MARYIRPASEVTYNGDGSSYAAAAYTGGPGAWRKLTSINWTTVAAEEDRTLFIAGVHHYQDGGIPFSTGSGSDDDHRIIVASCEAQYGANTGGADNPGVIWSGKLFTSGSWTGYDEANNVYSQVTIVGSTANYPQLAMELSDAVNGQYLIPTQSLAECQATPGSVFAVNTDGDDTLYYHPADTTKNIVFFGSTCATFRRTAFVTVKGLRFNSLLRCVQLNSDETTERLHHVTFEDCEFYYGTFAGMFVYLSVQDVLVKNCSFWDNAIGFGVNPAFGNADRITVDGCYFSHTTMRYMGPPYENSQGDESAVFVQNGCNFLTVRDCVIENWRGEGIFLYPNSFGGLTTCTDALIERNWVQLADVDDGQMSACILFSGGGETTLDMGDTAARGVIRNNVLLNGVLTSYPNSWQGGIRIKLTKMTNPEDRIKIYNNTIYNCFAGFQLKSPGGTNDDLPCLIYNNIVASPSQVDGYFVRVGAGTYEANSLELKNNCYYGTGKWSWTDGVDISSFANWVTASGETGAVTGDPLFTDAANGDFTLSSTSSSCYNAGTDTGLTEDYAGTSRPQGVAFDIGAFEFFVDGSPQIARPIADIAKTNWVVVGGTDAWEVLDEETPSDTDYAYTSTPGAVLEVRLTACVDPATDAGYTFSYRARGRYTAAVVEGSTVIESWQHDDADFTTHTQTLTLAGNIADHADLRLRITAGS